MSKIYPYKILHLDHEGLIALERKINAGAPVDQNIEAVTDYKGLLSNKPRYDPTIREHFGSRYKSLEESVEDVKRDVGGLNAEKLARKVAAANSLLEKGFYKEVAQVDSKSAQEAVMATISVNKPWMSVSTKKVVPSEDAWRSTESYDVIQRFDEFFLKMPLGFVDLQEGTYARELV